MNKDNLKRKKEETLRSLGEEDVDAANQILIPNKINKLILLINLCFIFLFKIKDLIFNYFFIIIIFFSLCLYFPCIEVLLKHIGLIHLYLYLY
jgi:hypothetical protein